MKASRLLVQPSAFFTGPPSLILRCESFSRGQDGVYKYRFLWGNITWSEIGQQNIQAKKGQ